MSTNLTLSRGERKTHRVTIDNPPAGGMGAWSWRLYVYPDGKVTDPLVSKLTGFSVSGSAVAITWDAADTDNLTPGSYPYVLLGSDNNLVASSGALTVKPGVPSS